MTKANRAGSLRSGLLRLLFGVTVFVFCAAPTPGDIGGCGQRALPLDPDAFFGKKKEIDCDRCKECDFHTDFCKSACDPKDDPGGELPEGCDPIVHDAEVCLNALEAANCDDYEAYVRDEGRDSPNECRFCPWGNE
jgi:hypothetical protein